MTTEEQQLFQELVYCYRRIGIPVIKETLEVFLECTDKQKMVDNARQWAQYNMYHI
jgi:hypothetical protein